MQQVGTEEMQNLMDAFTSLDFPATREDVIACAEDSGVSDDIAVRLNNLPDQEYKSAEDIVAYLRP